MKKTRRKVRIDRVAMLAVAIMATFWAIWALFRPRPIDSRCYTVSRSAMPLPLSQCLAETWSEEDLPKYKSIGTFRITYYCPGSCCNGHNAGVDCKGNPLVPGTIATNDLPYGTKVYFNLDGMMCEYTVRDRMAKKDRPMPAIDVFMDLPHDTVQNMGVDYVEVFVLDE